MRKRRKVGGEGRVWRVREREGEGEMRKMRKVGGEGRVWRVS